MIYDLDDIDRARRTAFERQWAQEHDIPFEDISRLGWAAWPTFIEGELRPQWNEMMMRGPCIAEIVVKLATP